MNASCAICETELLKAREDASGVKFLPCAACTERGAIPGYISGMLWAVVDGGSDDPDVFNLRQACFAIVGKQWKEQEP
jgi:hypothetical protein